MIVGGQTEALAQLSSTIIDYHEPFDQGFARSSRIQRCRSFSERFGPRVIFLKAGQVSSCSKRSREITTQPIVVLTKIGGQ